MPELIRDSEEEIDYTKLLILRVRAFALGEQNAIREVAQTAHGLSPAVAAERIGMSVRSNRQKRFEKLEAQMPVMNNAFPDWPEEIRAYVAETPLEPYEEGDELQFLEWLRRKALNAEQRDCVAWMNGRLQLERLAGTQRHAYLRFQELCSVRQDLRAAFAREENLGCRTIRVNPVRLAVQLETPLLLEGANPPAWIVLAVNGDDITTVMLEEEQIRLLERFPSSGVCTLKQWHQHEPEFELDELAECALQLSDSGILAIS